MAEASSNIALVKLYLMTEPGTWDDQGVGLCSYITSKDIDPDEIHFQSEDERSSYHFEVAEARKYVKEDDTMIVWTEDDKQEFALSFKDKESCENVWNRISDHIKDRKAAIDRASQDDPIPRPDDATSFESNEDDALPMPALSNLLEIVNTLKSAKEILEKDKHATFIINNEYITKLGSVFEMCEDLENTEDLYTIYTIMVAIILLDEHTIIEHIVQDDNVLGVMGMLEYNSPTPDVKANHREFLEKHTHIEKIVPIENGVILSKIRSTFRLQYLKNVVLRNDLSEKLASIFDSLIQFNHNDIISEIQSDSKSLDDVFDMIHRKDAVQPRQDAIRFVHYLCTMARSAQQHNRSTFYKTLAPRGLFDAFEQSLTDEDPVMRKASVTALSSMIETDTGMALIWNHILDQMRGNIPGELMKAILERFIADTDYDVKSQHFEIIKAMLEPMARPPSELIDETKRRSEGDLSEDIQKLASDAINEFLNLYYEQYGTLLLEPSKALEEKPIKLDGPIEMLDLSADQSSLYLHILEILCLAVRNHGTRCKTMIMYSDCCRKMVQLYRCREAHIKLAVLRLIRYCVSTIDKFYVQHLIKSNVFEATIRILLDTDGRDNLLNSACLELLEFIRKENIKLLIHHLITEYGSVLDTLTYAQTCKQLRLRHEQNMDMSGGITTNDEAEKASISSWDGNGHGAWGSSTLDDDEEDYFNGPEEEEADDETGESSSGTSASEDGQPDARTDPAVEASSPRPSLPPQRKRPLDEDDEDDVLATKSDRRSDSTPPPTKKLIIKTQHKRRDPDTSHPKPFSHNGKERG